jgi:hypothetical protein
VDTSCPGPRVRGLYDGASTAELDRLSIQTAAELLAEEPECSKLAARLLAGYIDKEVRDLAQRDGPHPAYGDTRAARGQLQPDLWGVTSTQTARWERLRTRVDKYGLRNSLLVAIAPTATIASIAGSYECIEPAVSNVFKRETLSGEFLQINTALVAELKTHGLWTEEIRTAIKRADGSVQGIAALPEDVRTLFRTAWELPQRALIDLAAARALRRPEPVAKPVRGLPDDREAVVDVPLRLEGGSQEHVLPTLPARHPYPASHRQPPRHRRGARRGRLLP